MTKLLRKPILISISTLAVLATSGLLWWKDGKSDTASSIANHAPKYPVQCCWGDMYASLPEPDEHCQKPSHDDLLKMAKGDESLLPMLERAIDKVVQLPVCRKLYKAEISTEHSPLQGTPVAFIHFKISSEDTPPFLLWVTKDEALGEAPLPLNLKPMITVAEATENCKAAIKQRSTFPSTVQFGEMKAIWVSEGHQYQSENTLEQPSRQYTYNFTARNAFGADLPLRADCTAYADGTTKVEDAYGR